jgi:hypothetical protein
MLAWQITSIGLFRLSAFLPIVFRKEFTEVSGVKETIPD